MNATRDLFRRTSLLFAKYPVLWLPLVMADVIRSLIQLLSRPLTRAAMMAAAPRSAFGGVAGAPSPGTIAAIGGGIGFVVTAIGLLLYLYALGIVARSLAQDTFTPSQAPRLRFPVPEGLLPAWLQAAGLAAVFVVFSTVWITGIVVPWTSRAHFRPASVQWIALAGILPVAALLLYFAVDILRRYVLRVQSQPLAEPGPRIPYFLLLLVTALFSNLAAIGIAFATRRSMSVPGVTQSLPFLLFQLLVSAATALPYAYAMTGLSLSLTGPHGTDNTLA